ncbi:YjjG family noncanonical pyrimidine nucleotidase [Mammaliicoccus sp. Dog046]|uniref:YjjG family noncanonical pyrimidine nucleotidase n=1 Tax=Mammaliicoccus sp. Dog046 TaxID=3034233 RepID=UPI002B259F4C|nr:YjjG family noncanonical pyrimidine nucleotidase [Mammaliicoccus sp. Dog046]WQK86028.1 YjjG family noncanonical pyrimidine nucleotidase [Mammaliicoccus sp. Dog046]
MYKYILLDLDNTLLDFNDGEKEAIKAVFQSEGVEFNDANFKKYKTINKQLWSELEQGLISKEAVLVGRFKQIFDSLNLEVDPYAKEDIFRNILDNNHTLVDGAIDILEYLTAAGYRLYSASNGVYSTQMKRMKASGIIDYFEDHFISEKIGHEKPDKRFFEHCLNTIGDVNKQHILMVGDTYSSDIIGAQLFGIDACYYNHNQESANDSATYEIYQLTDLKNILKGN